MGIEEKRLRNGTNEKTVEKGKKESKNMLNEEVEATRGGKWKQTRKIFME